YREVLRIAPEDHEAVRSLAILYFEQGQVAEAYQFLKLAADATPDDNEIQLRLGLTFLSAGQFKLARDIAVELFNNQPDNKDVLLLLIDSSRKAAELDEIKEWLR